MQTCSCPLCSQGNYNPSEFQVDLSELKRERPVGVSGLMRVRNGGRWLALSIDSCIEALDELIICYQESIDETATIIEQKQQQYPDKIKVFFYAPKVYFDFLSEEEFWYAYSLPKDSIHLFSNYSNYALSKTTYKYVVKMDADQIYFTDRLSKLCDAYRGIGVYKYSLIECMAYYFIRFFYRLHSHIYWVVKIIDKFPVNGNMMEFYSSYLYRLVYKTKLSVSLSGINLYRDGEEWGIPVFIEGSTHPLVFNGCGDLFVFTVSDKSFYTPAYQSPKESDQSDTIRWNPVYTVYRIIETFHCNSKIVHGGFYWFHMKFADIREFDKKSISLGKCYDDFRKMKINDLFKSGLIKNDRYYFGPHLFFFKYDKSISDPDKIIGNL